MYAGKGILSREHFPSNNDLSKNRAEIQISLREKRKIVRRERDIVTRVISPPKTTCPKAGRN